MIHRMKRNTIPNTGSNSHMYTNIQSEIACENTAPLSALNMIIQGYVPSGLGYAQREWTFITHDTVLVVLVGPVSFHAEAE